MGRVDVFGLQPPNGVVSTGWGGYGLVALAEMRLAHQVESPRSTDLADLGLQRGDILFMQRHVLAQLADARDIFGRIGSFLRATVAFGFGQLFLAFGQ